MRLRLLTVAIVVPLLSLTLLAGPAVAKDNESGTLACPAGAVVWVRERTSAGITTVSWTGRRVVLRKTAWSTTLHRTGLRSTWWQVATSGAMDHKVTTAYCGN
jgi:hypothetical protein